MTTTPDPRITITIKLSAPLRARLTKELRGQIEHDVEFELASFVVPTTIGEDIEDLQTTVESVTVRRAKK